MWFCYGCLGTLSDGCLLRRLVVGIVGLVFWCCVVVVCGLEFGFLGCDETFLILCECCGENLVVRLSMRALVGSSDSLYLGRGWY